MKGQDDNVTLTTQDGEPVFDDNNSITIGPSGPILLQDYKYLDKIAHFDRERIPERVVHAKGSGAHGYFEVTTNEMAKYCKAKVFESVGKKTPVLARFSTVGGEKGSADTARDPRGFAVKFYTEEGNWDMVGNNTPVFFIRDPSKFPDFIHTQKRHPRTNMPDANMFWDFLSLVPESLHQVTILMSDRGVPDGYRHMNGYSSHTFLLTNEDDKSFWCQFHFKTEQGIKNIIDDEAKKIAGEDPDYAQRDLYEHIEAGDYPSWKVCVQIMEYEDAATYRFNPFDITKVWPHGDYPLIEIGRMVLNRNPDNYFAEIEQAAFSPSSLVPGIQPSPDRMLQGRLFSYPDTHRHRLGVNYLQIPVNCPYATRVNHYQRDGFMTVNGNHGSAPNYFPNSEPGTPQPADGTDVTPTTYDGLVGRHKPDHPNDDFVQPGNLYRLMNEDEQKRLVNNIATRLVGARKDIQDRMVEHFTRADPNYGKQVAAALAALSKSKL